MSVMYKSTRGTGEEIPASVAILKGISEDGGLYVPVTVPKMDKTLSEYAKMTYQEVAYEVMKLFFTDFTEEELKDCIQKAYDEKFDTEEIAPLAEAHGAFYLELFHGATIAFKDMALSILPHLMTTAAKKNHIEDKIVILTATSGDTGKAALAGFADVPGTEIIVFYPKGGVSSVQEKQMTTQVGKNVHVVAVKGNFDDAQTGVKKIFNDAQMKERMTKAGARFSSANSINIGRLFPQVVYYVYAYSRLLKEGKIADGEAVNFVVPTGNFGNILAAFFAKQMGLPVAKLICASNDNKVLVDFFKSGTYDRNRQFILTTSPSMDILISSNLERLIYLIAGRDGEKTAAFMESLSKDGKYSITDEMKKQLDDFYGDFSTEKEVSECIREVYEDCGYVMDTHTAVAASVYEKYKKKTGDATKSVIASTASPFKFVRSVMSAIDEKYANEEDFALMDALCKVANVEEPNAITAIRDAAVLHTLVCEKDEMKDTVAKILNI